MCGGTYLFLQHSEVLQVQGEMGNTFLKRKTNNELG